MNPIADSTSNGSTDRLFEMLNQQQRGFPLVERPFEWLGAYYRLPVDRIMHCYQDWLASGVLSRVGGVFNQAAGGASLLAAMAVPAHDLERVAAIVSGHSGVNHNYEREHIYNLWFVMTGPNAAAVEAAMQDLDSQTGYPTLRLPMVRPYRIDLAFNLTGALANHAPTKTSTHAVPLITAQQLPLAALSEEGLAIVQQPYTQWAQSLGWSTEAVMACIGRWLESGVLRRFGNVVRHHELGFDCNAMTVFDLPQDRVDAIGAALAQTPEVTLAYQRARAPGWNYNLYCMVHGTQRDQVNVVIERLLDTHGLRRVPHAVLFSVRRFKQTGARRYRNAA